MDPFVRRLIERLNHPDGPLSRNRHFHTFDTPEGRLALRTSRRLKGLARDILTCMTRGQRAELIHRREGEGHRVELRLHWISGRRVSLLSSPEFELLLELPGVKDALKPSGRSLPL